MMMSGRDTLDQVGFSSVVFNEPEAYRLKLENDLAKFVDNGITVIDEGRIRFAGEERKAMYAKYYARKRGVSEL